jgi:glycosyltransferase involved in cell wall biosynthesis
MPDPVKLTRSLSQGAIIAMTHDDPDRVPRVTILTPVYNEEAALLSYERRVGEVLLARTDYDFQVLLIDDGSRDRSWEIIRAMCARNPQLRAIRLSRNFGSHTALTAGFTHTDDDCVATLACDLQDPPEVILEFLDHWRAGAQIVWGKRRSRQDESWRIWTSRVFSELLRRHAMPPGSKFTTGSFLLSDRKVVECYRQFPEQNRITFALMAWTGFQQEVVEYDRASRIAGRSSWNLSRMLKVMYDAFIGFSYLPIRLTTLVGVFTSLCAFVLLVYTLISWLAGVLVRGWTSLVSSLAFFFGIQFLLMGLMGEYLHRIYIEVTRRPLFFISEEIGPLCDQWADRDGRRVRPAEVQAVSLMRRGVRRNTVELAANHVQDTTSSDTRSCGNVAE